MSSSSSSAVAGVTKTYKKRKVVSLRELPLFPLTPGDLKYPLQTSAHANNVHVGDEVMLRLALPDHQPMEEIVWKITKVLTKSDINNSSRLLITAQQARNELFPHLTPEERGRVESGDGAVEMAVWDMDTASEHRLRFKKWNSSGGYVFNNEWQSGFVRRRQLKEGDQLGLHFDSRHSRLLFSLLKRAPIPN